MNEQQFQNDSRNVMNEMRQILNSYLYCRLDLDVEFLEVDFVANKIYLYLKGHFFLIRTILISLVDTRFIYLRQE